MSDAAEIVEAEPAEQPRKGKLGLILGVVGALALGGGGFYAVYAGIVDPSGLFAHEEHAEQAALDGIAFVPMDPIMISLAPGGSAKHLRFAGQLEVAPEHSTEVAGLMPRILDVLNTYLRAVEVRDLEQPASIARLRAQMLRRVQVVTGEGRVRDLLITEFVLN
jgi:flagellar protein FliL